MVATPIGTGVKRDREYVRGETASLVAAHALSDDLTARLQLPLTEGFEAVLTVRAGRSLNARRVYEQRYSDDTGAWQWLGVDGEAKEVAITIPAGSMASEPEGDYWYEVATDWYGAVTTHQRGVFVIAGDVTFDPTAAPEPAEPRLRIASITTLDGNGERAGYGLGPARDGGGVIIPGVFEEWVYYAKLNAGGRDDIWRIRPDGTGAFNITGAIPELTGAHCSTPTVDPTGVFLIFQREDTSYGANPAYTSGGVGYLNRLVWYNQLTGAWGYLTTMGTVYASGSAEWGGLHPDVSPGSGAGGGKLCWMGFLERDPDDTPTLAHSPTSVRWATYTITAGAMTLGTVRTYADEADPETVLPTGEVGGWWSETVIGCISNTIPVLGYGARQFVLLFIDTSLNPPKAFLWVVDPFWNEFPKRRPGTTHNPPVSYAEIGFMSSMDNLGARQDAIGNYGTDFYIKESYFDAPAHRVSYLNVDGHPDNVFAPQVTNWTDFAWGPLRAGETKSMRAAVKFASSDQLTNRIVLVEFEEE